MRPRETSADLNELLAEEKYTALREQLRPSDDEPLFVPQAGAASKLRLRQFDGGRDAKYIVITRADPALDIDQPLAETIGFARSVQGVEIIYDATSAAMQGKTRPFTCDLTGIKSRVFALMPVQIEAIAVTVKYYNERLLIRCGFLDAGGTRMLAALPFEATVISADGNQRARVFGCTERTQGSIEIRVAISSLKLGRRFQVVVRSLLTGFDQRVTVENP
jgi:hypothetical protein